MSSVTPSGVGSDEQPSAALSWHSCCDTSCSQGSGPLLGAFPHLDLHEAALPVMATLRHSTGETVQLAVLDGLESVYIDRLESPHTVRIFARVGTRLPATTTVAPDSSSMRTSDMVRGAVLGDRSGDGAGRAAGRVGCRVSAERRRPRPPSRAPRGSRARGGRH